MIRMALITAGSNENEITAITLLQVVQVGITTVSVL
jgi:hypothetical protein